MHISTAQINEIMMAMIAFDQGDAKRIQHFIKVYQFVALIAEREQVDADTAGVLKVAAILHDIGIHPSEQRYGDCNGKHQEELGPQYARELLAAFPWAEEAFVERVCYLIGHHHTYTNVEGIDYQILIEADFLVNAFEDGLGAESIQTMRTRIFRTQTGIRLLEEMYGLGDSI